MEAGGPSPLGCQSCIVASVVSRRAEAIFFGFATWPMADGYAYAISSRRVAARPDGAWLP